MQVTVDSLGLVTSKVTSTDWDPSTLKPTSLYDTGLPAMARPIQTTTASPTTAATTMPIRPRRADRAVGSGPYRPAGGRVAGDSVTTAPARVLVRGWRDAGAA